MSYEELRHEFTRGSFREEMVRTLGCTCFNCGSSENIEYHHAVPLRLGGTNKMKNILALCHRCHVAAHTGRDINQIKSNPKRSGRPKKWLYSEECDEHFWKWAEGRIGTKRLKEIFGMGNRVHVKGTDMYRGFIEKYGISDIKNVRDMVVHKQQLSKVCKTSTIYYIDGRVVEHEHEIEVTYKPRIVKASGLDDLMIVRDGKWCKYNAV